MIDMNDPRPAVNGQQQKIRSEYKLGAVRDAWIRWVNNHPRLRDRAKLVGVTYITLYPNQTLYKSEGVLVAWAGIDRLRRDCGLSRGALDRNLKLLVKHDLLSPWTGPVPRELKEGRPTQPYVFNMPPTEFFEFVSPRVGKTRGVSLSHSRREKLESENTGATLGVKGRVKPGSFSHSETSFSHSEREFFPRESKLCPKTLDSAIVPSDRHSDRLSEKEGRQRKVSEGTKSWARAKGCGAHPLPEGWVPKVPPKTEAGKRELAKMRDWALANDARRSDWDAQWRNWKIKAVEYMKRDAPDDPARVRFR
jgi:hypothetical protein